MTRNEAYWGDQAGSDRLIVRWSTEAAQRLVELQSGTVDGIDNIGPTDFETVDNDPNLALMPREGLNVFYVGFNNKFEPFNDVKVRQAIALGIDRQRIVDNFYPPGSEVASHFTPCSIPNGCAGDPWYDFDPAAAKALLAEAGHAKGLTLTAKLPPVAYARRGGEILAAQLAKAGITVELIPIEWAQWLDEVFKQTNYQLTIVSHTEPNDIGIYGRDSYYFNYKSDRFRAVLAELAATTDEAKRTELLGQAQRILAEDAVVGFLFQLPLITVADAKLQGYWQNAPIAGTPLAAMSWSE
jgi:peptide/nickel transport system substrate-binding protein